MIIPVYPDNDAPVLTLIHHFNPTATDPARRWVPQDAFIMRAEESAGFFKEVSTDPEVTEEVCEQMREQLCTYHKLRPTQPQNQFVNVVSYFRGENIPLVDRKSVV